MSDAELHQPQCPGCGQEGLQYQEPVWTKRDVLGIDASGIRPDVADKSGLVRELVIDDEAEVIWEASEDGQAIVGCMKCGWEQNAYQYLRANRLKVRWG